MISWGAQLYFTALNALKEHSVLFICSKITLIFPYHQSHDSLALSKMVLTHTNVCHSPVWSIYKWTPKNKKRYLVWDKWLTSSFQINSSWLKNVDSLAANMTAKLCRRCEEMKRGHEIEPLFLLYSKGINRNEVYSCKLSKKVQKIMGSKTLHTYSAG